MGIQFRPVMPLAPYLGESYEPWAKELPIALVKHHYKRPGYWRVVRCPFCGLGSHTHQSGDETINGIDYSELELLGIRIAPCWGGSYRLVAIEDGGRQTKAELDEHSPIVDSPRRFS